MNNRNSKYRAQSGSTDQIHQNNATSSISQGRPSSQVNPLDNLYQPMFQQNPPFYQAPGIPNPLNIGNTLPNYGNYNTAFAPTPEIKFNGVQPKGMFNNNGFVNRGGLLHNDLYDIILNEEIREYYVLIDSKDRNYQMYPNPFQYNVQFSPLPTSKGKVNGKKVSYEIPNPTINEAFTNVRYIVLENAVLPIYNKVRSVNKEIIDEGAIRTVKDWKVNINRPLTENLYVVLTIGEYNDINMRSTNDVLSDSFATIYYDYNINQTHYMGNSSNGIKIFRPDQLGNITNWTISFSDPYGNILGCPHVDKNIKSSMECICDDDYEDPDCYRHNLFHCMNPIYQHNLCFRVGVVEPRLNKMVFS